MQFFAQLSIRESGSLRVHGPNHQRDKCPCAMVRTWPSLLQIFDHFMYHVYGQFFLAQQHYA